MASNSLILPRSNLFQCTVSRVELNLGPGHDLEGFVPTPNVEPPQPLSIIRVSLVAARFSGWTVNSGVNPTGIPRTAREDSEGVIAADKAWSRPTGVYEAWGVNGTHRSEFLTRIGVFWQII